MRNGAGGDFMIFYFWNSNYHQELALAWPGLAWSG